MRRVCLCVYCLVLYTHEVVKVDDAVDFSEWKMLKRSLFFFNAKFRSVL